MVVSAGIAVFFEVMTYWFPLNFIVGTPIALLACNNKLKLEYNMPITFDSALGIHQNALALRSQRAEVLASNIANADTPGYKARDIDFKSALESVKQTGSTSLATTHSKHIQMNNATKTSEVLYRVPLQPSLDGNTVDGLVEKSSFAENALHYQASLTFLDGKFKGMMAALKGE